MGCDNPLRIPEPLRHDVDQILTDPFCVEHLNAEYAEIVRKLIASWCESVPRHSRAVTFAVGPRPRSTQWAA
jgi:hypothetical protein